MADESSPLLQGVNGTSDPSTASYRSQSYVDDSQFSLATSVSIGAGNDLTDQLFMGFDKRELLATPSCGLSTNEATRRLKVFGTNQLPADELSLGTRLFRHAFRPKAALVWIAMSIELVQEKFASAVALLFLQVVTSAVAWGLEAKAHIALAALKAVRKSEAVVVRDGVHQTMNASLLVPGDRLTLSAGAIVPADCELCPGTLLQIDQSLLTGESFAVSLSATDGAKMGSSVIAGEGDAIVVATGPRTFLAGSSELLAGEETPHFEKAVLRFTVALLLVVAIAATSVLVLEIVHRGEILRVLAYIITLSVIAAPVSMPAICKLVVILGSRRLLDDKISLARLEALEKLASVDMLCCDKTGTLTRNKLELQDDLPIFDPRGTREDVLVSAALAARWKEPPRDAVDTLVLNAIDLRPLDQYVQLDHSAFDPISKRTESVIRGPTGRVFKVTKGAPEALLALACNAEDVRDAVEAKVMDLARRGISSLAVARTEEYAEGKWIFLGVITYLDPARHDSKRMIERAHNCGISVKLITGDQAAIAVEACRQLGMGMTVLGADSLPFTESVAISKHASHAPEISQVSTIARVVEAADAYAHVLPGHKAWILESLQKGGWCCGVTCASVSDVPAMKVANLAIAVDGACDAIRASADVVLAKAGLSVILSGILSARRVFVCITNYLTFQTMATTHLVLWFTVSSILIRPDGCRFEHFIPRHGHCGELEDPVGAEQIQNAERVDPLFHVPIVALVAFGLAQELVSVALLHDKSGVQTPPHNWGFSRVLAGALGAGIPAAVSTVLFVFWAFDSWNTDGVFAVYGVSGLVSKQVATAVFLQVGLLSTFSVLVTRFDRHIFSRLPAPPLAIIVFTIAASFTSFAIFSPISDLAPISAKHAIFVWVYTLLWLFVLNLTKLGAAVVVEELLKLGSVEEDAKNKRLCRLEAQRKNRIRLGLAFRNDETTARGSFVVGRAVKLGTQLSHTSVRVGSNHG